MEIFLLMGVALMVILIIVIIYNNIIRRMNAVARAWTDVVTQERQKNNVLPALEKIASEYKEYETIIITEITKLRTDLQRLGSDSNLLIVFYVQIMPDDLVMQLHRF